jgi:Xaa-Pro aminopeptidase
VRRVGQFRRRNSDCILSVFFSYAIVTTDKIILFVEREQLTEDALGYLGDQVEIRPYNSFFDYLKDLTLSLELDNEWVSFIRRISF